MNTLSLVCTDSLYMPNCPVLTEQENRHNGERTNALSAHV